MIKAINKTFSILNKIERIENFARKNDIDYIKDDNIVTSELIYPMGYLESDDLENDDPSYQEVSDYNAILGDLDTDGLDEMITLSNGSITIRKNDGIILSGFPINNNYQNSILIADLLGDNSPEIISTTENTIEIISHEGKVLEEFPLYNPDSD